MGSFGDRQTDKRILGLGYSFTLHTAEGSQSRFTIPWPIGKPACLIVRFLFEFASDSVFVKPNSETAILSKDRDRGEYFYLSNYAHSWLIFFSCSAVECFVQKYSYYGVLCKTIGQVSYRVIAYLLSCAGPFFRVCAEILVLGRNIYLMYYSCGRGKRKLYLYSMNT